MFTISNFAPDGFIIEAKGKITKEDYIKTLAPFLDKIKEEQNHIKIIFKTAEDFDGYSFGGAFEDLKLGIHHFHTIAKLAIVSDVKWICNACKFFRFLIPCPVEIFSGSEFEEAKSWLTNAQSHIKCNFDSDKKVAVIEISGKLSSEDFKILSHEIDPIIVKHENLQGLVIHVKKFPFWENISAFIDHISFIKNHHHKIKKVAIAADGVIPEFAPKIAKHFIKAEIKNFHYEQLQEAKDWAEK